MFQLSFWVAVALGQLSALSFPWPALHVLGKLFVKAHGAVCLLLNSDLCTGQQGHSDAVESMLEGFFSPQNAHCLIHGLSAANCLCPLEAEQEGCSFSCLCL